MCSVTVFDLGTRWRCGQLHAAAALPQGKRPCHHYIGGFVGPRAVMDAVVKRKIPSPPPGIEP
jgi:hypothetical protein